MTTPHAAAEQILAERLNKAIGLMRAKLAAAPSSSAPALEKVECLCPNCADTPVITTSVRGEHLTVSMTPGTDGDGAPIQYFDIGNEYTFTVEGAGEIADFKAAMKALLG